jgi:alcohol dehydrogenase class IV
MTFDKIYQYNFPPPSVSALAQAQKLGDYLIKNNLQKPLIVTDPTVSQLAFFKPIIDELKKKKHFDRNIFRYP